MSTAATSARTPARGTAASRDVGRGCPASDDAEPVVRLADWLEPGGHGLDAVLERLFVPRNDPLWLRRNALVALGNDARPEDMPLASSFLDDPDPVLRAVAGRAEARIEERGT